VTRHIPHGRRENLKKFTSEGKRSVGKPRKRWVYDVEHYLKKTGVRRLEKNRKG
jgi:hypothetical protein